MYSVVLVSVILLSAILLILVILAQNSKGGGLTSQFGGTGASGMIGVKKTTDLLEKITWGLAAVVLGLSLLSNINIQRNNEIDFTDRIEETAPATPSLEGVDGAGTGADTETLEGLQDAIQSGDSTN